MDAISSVDALISCVEAEISVAIAAASSAAARIAPTSRRNATTMECTDDSRSATSLASVRCADTVTDRSPPATRLAIAPAARTGSVMVRCSTRASANTNATLMASSSTPPQITSRTVWRAAA